MSNDLVSIITPSYNTAKFILETIESVVAQTYSNWEMIIVDDCSTDNSVEIIENYIQKNNENRIRLFVNQKNSGAALSRNLALREAKGRWIAFLDSDDLWLPSKLCEQIAFMEEYNYHFSYTQYCEIDENGDSLGVIISGPRKIAKKDMYNYCWPGCLTVMYDSLVVGVIQIENIKKNNDYAIWLKISQHVNCYLFAKDLGRYRKRLGSISNHSLFVLIKWHYKLFRDAEKQTNVEAIFNTLRNIGFGLLKKIVYVKKRI
jgi:glycosyltransferase involved in cell wall biosynthesis